MLPKFTIIYFYFHRSPVHIKTTAISEPLSDLMAHTGGPPSLALSWFASSGPLEHPTHGEGLLSYQTGIHSFSVGTGESIFCSSGLLDAIEDARAEVVFVTCYWARSTTLTQLSEALTKLSTRSLARIKQTSKPRNKVRVRILFSSLSLTQKLFHTNSPRGKTWPPKHWVRDLGLPDPSELEGLDLEVKSVFIKPFSVMHPKYVVIDRKKVWQMSANVSWESWLEGVIELSGAEVVKEFVDFFERTWNVSYAGQLHTVDHIIDSHADLDQINESLTRSEHSTSEPSLKRAANASQLLAHEIYSSPKRVCTVLLPSPQHANPRCRPFPCMHAAPPPRTPLNTFLLHLFTTANKSIYIQTPNLTSSIVLDHLIEALNRGVDVEVVVSRGMMVLEQLVTAGATTSMCVERLIERYRKICRNDVRRIDKRKPRSLSTFNAPGRVPLRDEESQNSSSPLTRREHAVIRPLERKIGRLRISYFKHSDERGRTVLNVQTVSQPVHNHLKLTIVDSYACVMGSGNMDRASWYTSQELGLAVLDAEFTAKIKQVVERVLQGRTMVTYESEAFSVEHEYPV